MPAWLPATDPKVRAKELDIDPSYDLPSSTDHTEEKLQTLFFPDRLEPKLSSLHSATRALQEDAGISALHCAIGFLEWYDAEDSPDPAYAPLVLLPVNMEKRIANGEYVFSIAGRDDDETANVALREKLKRLALDLPDYDPEAGIEPYLASVAAALTNRPRWRVRRWATIGLFSFSRQAMWSDLDPSRWPAAARPEAHPLLGQIYGDVVAEHSETIAAVHDVDHPDLEMQAPALVTDADASQLSAVIDAAVGKNLVVQGPPGTGKSQAITNIIANALWHGKSILFVSEKMAALKVVKDRLDHMGLGLYCLEVHSAKASKTLVLKSIRERMQSPRMLSNADEVERARSSLRQSRQRLTEYAALMNSPAGETGLTTHQVLWGDFSRAERPICVPASALDFRFPDPLAVDRFKLSDLIGAGKALDDLALAMGPTAEPAHQPWRGIGNLNLNRFDRVKAIELVSQWAAALERLNALTGELGVACGWDALASISDVRGATTLATELPTPAPGIEEAILALATEDIPRQSLSSWAELAVRAHEHDTQIDALCLRAELERDPDAALRLVEEAKALGIADTPVEGVPQICDDARASAEVMRRIVQLLADLFAAARRDPTAAPDIKAEAMAAGFLHVMRQLPPENVRYRSAALSEDSAIEELTAAQAIANEANAAADAAKFGEPPNMVLAQSIPAIHELRHAAGIIRATGFFGKLFGGDWRKARAIWRKTFPTERKIVPLEAARRLIFAAQWKECLGKLEATLSAKAAAGRHWRDAGTPFEQLLQVAAWMKSVRNVTPLAETGARELRHLAYEGAPDDMAMLSDLAQAAAELNLLGVF
jgi:hypothetical protein